MTVALGVRTVPSGYRGVKTQFGQIIGTTGEGLQWVNVWFGEDIINMDLQIHEVSLDNLSCGTSDLQEVKTSVSVNYRIEEGFVMEIYRTLRTEWESRVILNNMQESLKGTTASFRAEELIQKRESVKLYFLETLQERLEPYHITIINVQLKDYQFSPTFTAAIEAKVTAEQKALEERNNLEIVKYQQEQELTKQQYEARMKVIRAEADANATITRAMADAEAIRLITERLSLSPEYLNYLAVLRWDGKLPYFYGSDLPLPFISVQETP